MRIEQHCLLKNHWLRKQEKYGMQNFRQGVPFRIGKNYIFITHIFRYLYG